MRQFWVSCSTETARLSLRTTMRTPANLRSDVTLHPGAYSGAGGSIDTETPILILGLAGLSMHHGALGAIRSAGRLGIRVLHAHRERRSPIDRSRYSSGSLVLPQDHVGDRTLDALHEFGAANRGAILLAVDDASAMFVEDHSDSLSKVFVFLRQPAGLVRALAH